MKQILDLLFFMGIMIADSDEAWFPWASIAGRFGGCGCLLPARNMEGGEMTYFPGKYCDTTERVHGRVKDFDDLLREVRTDGIMLGVKMGMIAGFLLAGLGLLIAWPW